MNDWLPAVGKLEIDNGIRIVLDDDFCRYYLRLFHQSIWFTKRYQLPMHGCHIGIYNVKLHPPITLANFADLAGQQIEFEYNINLYKSRVNVWAPVRCQWADEFREKNQIPITYFDETSLHLTIGNIKFNQKP